MARPKTKAKPKKIEQLDRFTVAFRRATKKKPATISLTLYTRDHIKRIENIYRIQLGDDSAMMMIGELIRCWSKLPATNAVRWRRRQSLLSMRAPPRFKLGKMKRKWHHMHASNAAAGVWGKIPPLFGAGPPKPREDD